MHDDIFGIEKYENIKAKYLDAIYGRLWKPAW
jgi:hypothetical protein